MLVLLPLFLMSSVIIQFSKATAYHSFTSDVEVAAPEYVKLLNHSIMFYEGQRSGKLPANNRIPWRHDSALTDGSDVGLDLTGGYYDAGDYLKFTFPLCYTTFMLTWGATDYLKGYQLANQTGYLREQIQWSTDWLMKAHSQPTTLFVEVGDTALDNDYFGPDTSIPFPRPSIQINETNFGTDAGAMGAIAFASASMFFSNLAQSSSGISSDAAYAQTLMSHALELYNASHNIQPYLKYQASAPAISSAYPSTDYLDELILSGIIMYKATNNETYLNQALAFYNSATDLNTHKEPLDWDNKWAAIYILFAEVLANNTNATLVQQTRTDAETYLDGLLTGATTNKTAGGLLYWNDYSLDNSNQPALSAGHLLLSYCLNVLQPLSETSIDKENILSKISKYQALALSQLDYILGKNPINQNYVCGERSNSPLYPSSAPAAGFASLSAAEADPTNLTLAHTIYGAVVGGPAKNDSFSDDRFDWAQTEVALDYNSPYQNLIAYQTMFSANGPFYAPSEGVLPPSNSDGNSTTSNGGGSSTASNGDSSSSEFPWKTIVAVVIPVVAVICLFALFFIRKRLRLRNHAINSYHNSVDKEEKGTVPTVGAKGFESTSTFNFDEKVVAADASFTAKMKDTNTLSAATLIKGASTSSVNTLTKDIPLAEKTVASTEYLSGVCLATLTDGSVSENLEGDISAAAIVFVTLTNDLSTSTTHTQMGDTTLSNISENEGIAITDTNLLEETTAAPGTVSSDEETIITK